MYLLLNAFLQCTAHYSTSPSLVHSVHRNITVISCGGTTAITLHHLQCSLIGGCVPLFCFICSNRYFAEHDKAAALQVLHDSLQPKHRSDPPLCCMPQPAVCTVCTYFVFHFVLFLLLLCSTMIPKQKTMPDLKSPVQLRSSLYLLKPSAACRLNCS